MMGLEERDPSSLKGKAVSVWWPQQQTFLRGTLVDYNKHLGTFECQYGTGGVDSFLMIQSYEEDEKGIRIMQHYLLDMPEHWKPTSTVNDHRRVMLGNPIGTPQLKRCEKCHHCVNMTTMKQACHQARSIMLAHFGHYGAQVSSQGPNAVGTRVSIFWPDDKSFYDGFVTDWNMFTWKHQILYDDGDVEERTLYKEKVRVCKAEELAKIVPGWLPKDEKDIASFSAKGRFRSRELKEDIIGKNVLVYCEERNWRPAKVSGYNDTDQAHKVDYTDGAKPASEQLVYTKHVMLVLQPGLEPCSSKRDAALDLEEAPMQKMPRFSEVEQAGAHTQQRLESAPGPSGNINPLMRSTADYSQIMFWVSEFLRHDPRVPRDAQKLMAIHEEVQQGQLTMGLDTSNPDMYYGHTFTAMGLPPDKWQNEAHATQAVQSAAPDMLMSFRCSQGLINTLFYPSRPQSASRHAPVMDKPQADPADIGHNKSPAAEVGDGQAGTQKAEI